MNAATTRNSENPRIRPWNRLPLVDPRILGLAASLAFLLLLAIAGADAETRTVPLKKENPLLGRTTLIYANVGLVLIVFAQVGLQVHKRRNKYKLAATTPAPPVASKAPAPSEIHHQAPKPQPMAPAPAPSPPPASALAKVVRCGSCGLTLKVSSPRFKCPKCATIGVVA